MSAKKAALPTLEELMAGAGLSIEEMARRLAELSQSFPGGIPDGAMRRWVDETFSTTSMLLVATQIGRGLERLVRTGKGPVGHSSVEVS